MIDRPFAEQFAALKLRFETREEVFQDQISAANQLDPTARSKKISTSTRTSSTTGPRSRMRSAPTRPTWLRLRGSSSPGPMRSFLAPDLVAVVRERFLDDPQMERLCEPLVSRTEEWAGALLQHIATNHPDHQVRGQATYALGLRSRSLAGRWLQAGNARSRSGSSAWPTRGGTISG